mgnify:CR=1 FL=1
MPFVVLYPCPVTFGDTIKESKNKKIIIVVTEKPKEQEVYVITAFPSTKKAEKLIRKQPLRRRQR